MWTIDWFVGVIKLTNVVLKNDQDDSLCCFLNRDIYFNGLVIYEDDTKQYIISGD